MAVLVSDNFNRANDPAAIGVATTGQTWISARNTWGNSTINYIQFLLLFYRQNLHTEIFHTIHALREIASTSASFLASLTLFLVLVNDEIVSQSKWQSLQT